MPKGVYPRRQLSNRRYVTQETKQKVIEDLQSGMTGYQVAKKYHLTRITVLHIKLGDWNPTRTRAKEMKQAELDLVAAERERCAQIMEHQFGEGCFMAELIRKQR